ncbi:MAG: hypothetical protein ACXWLM_06805, partial [Myxococcales bacterium]
MRKILGCALAALSVACGAAAPQDPADEAGLTHVGVVNGGFEDGLSGWKINNFGWVTADTHSGTWSAVVGSTGVNSDVGGDSSIAQTFIVPKGHPALSFWFRVHCGDGHDWATAKLTDRSGPDLTLAHACVDDSGWVHVTWDLGRNAGHKVTLSLQNHDDGHLGDPTWTQFDDVSLTDGGAAATLLAATRRGAQWVVVPLDPATGTAGAPVGTLGDLVGWGEQIVRQGNLVHAFGMDPLGIYKLYTLDLTTGASTSAAVPRGSDDYVGGILGTGVVVAAWTGSEEDVFSVNSWEQMGTLGDLKYVAQATVSGSILYALGHDGAGVYKLYSLDLATSAWTSVPLTRGYLALGTATWGGQLVVSFGNGSEQEVDTMDPQT